MKIRVRFEDGSTEKIDVDSNDTVKTVIENLRLTPHGSNLNGRSLFLSLNRKDSLSDLSTIGSCGVRGGDDVVQPGAMMV